MKINFDKVIKFTKTLGIIITGIEGILFQYNVMKDKKPKRKVNTNKFNDYKNKNRKKNRL